VARISVPHECLGIEMRDGTKYNRKREGFVEVTNERHLKEVNRSIARNLHWVGVNGTFFGGDSGPVCLCRRTAWPWEKTCPNCGRTL